MDASGAVDRAYAHVKAGILDRSYEGADVLTEGAVAEVVGVSRTPVREAFLRLEAEGLLRLMPKKGALVLPVSADELREVLETRRLVEGFLAVRAVPRAEALVVRLVPYLEAMRAHHATGDIPAFVEADRGFHMAAIEAGGNRILMRLSQSLRDRQVRMGVALHDDAPARRLRSIAEHELILAAFEAGDESAVRAAVSGHLDSVERTLRERT